MLDRQFYSLRQQQDLKAISNRMQKYADRFKDINNFPLPAAASSNPSSKICSGTSRSTKDQFFNSIESGCKAASNRLPHERKLPYQLKAKGTTQSTEPSIFNLKQEVSIDFKSLDSEHMGVARDENARTYRVKNGANMTTTLEPGGSTSDQGAATDSVEDPGMELQFVSRDLSPLGREKRKDSLKTAKHN